VETGSVTLSQGGNFRLDGKTAIVTGGASGIGFAIAKKFAASGATVQILDINRSAADTAAAKITATGGMARAYECDATHQASVKAVIGQIWRDGRVHILVNNAGIAHVGTLESTTETDLEKIFQVNVKSCYNCMQSCIGHMKSVGGGVILNMASIAGSAAVADRFAYSMSKGAIIAMTYSVAKDYLAHNIRCNCISPARVHTPFVDGFINKNYPGREQQMFKQLSQAQPIGRMAEPNEVAALALFLCSDDAAFITGVDYPIDGGFMNLR
jgi:NAD(P)-dependent dehydrogenase (short-subunit alcohol dehydrogenase family)